jgi:hypothetical protein
LTRLFQFFSVFFFLFPYFCFVYAPYLLSFSHGMRPDVASEKSLPYECDLCAARAKAPPKPPPSFLTATQLSDHLERRHNVRRHPSIIRPTKKASAAAAAAESCEGGTGWGVDGGGDAERDEQDLNL